MYKLKKDKIRKIIHVDMDAFFAAVEIRDNPDLKGKAVIVGGPPNSRGVVSTCSYEARKYGIHSAMASSLAYKLCPQAIFVKSNFEAYREASNIIREIFFEYTDLVEPASLDEAYLDVTSNKKNIKYATEIAKQIRQEIYKRTKLTASAGVSFNKFLAKIGSDMNKPDGMMVITPQTAMKILDELPIRKFHGIGAATEKKMLKLGIKNGADLRNFPLKILINHFGKVGIFYYNIIRGIDNREVKTSRIRKSLGSERTFSEDILDINKMFEFLKYDSDKISAKLEAKKIQGKTISIKLKYANFDVFSKSVTLRDWVSDKKTIFDVSVSLLEEILDPKRKVRLLGISLTNLISEEDRVWEQIKVAEYINNQEIETNS